MNDGWEDLSDGELCARLQQRGDPDADLLVANRDDFMARQVITKVLER